MTYSSTVLADSPSLFIDFDNGTTVTDSSTHAYTCTKSGTFTSNTGTPPDGGSLVFDGTTDYISVASVLDFGATSAWSVEVWFKTSMTGTYGEFLRRDGGGAAYLFRVNTGSIEFYGNVSGSQIISTATYNDGNWHHAVGVKNGTALTLYVDGVSVKTGTGNTVSQGTTNPVYIGSSNGTGEFYGGNMGSVALFPAALTSTQVTNHYNAGKPVNKTVTPPAATATLSMVNPVIAGPSVSVTVTPPAATMTLDTVAAKQLTGVPTAETSDSAGGGTIAVNTGTSTSSSGTYVNFTTPTIPTGKVLASAQLEWQFITVTTGYTLHFGQKTNTSTPAAMINSHDFTVGTGLFSNQYYSVDITDIVNNWIGGATNDGIGISKESTGGSGTVSLVGGTGSQGPKIVYNWTDAPPAVNITVTPPPMTLTLDMATAPVVSGNSNTTNTAPAMNLSLTFPGGIEMNPDYFASASPFVLSMSMTDPFYAGPNANVSVTPPPFVLSLSAPSGVTVDLTTNVLRVAPAMAMSLVMVGMFDAANDRYFAKVNSTVKSDDIWYKMDEASGNRAIDSIYDTTNNNWIQSGYYWGSPAFGTVGEGLRKAVTFNGLTDYLTVGPYSIDNKYATVGLANDVNAGMSTTIEFSIRTSQTDGGVVFASQGAQPQSVAATSPSSSVTALPVLNGCKVTMESGQMVIHDGTTATKVRKFIADGEWHHVVMAFPTGAINDVQSNPHYVMIDGQTITARYGPLVYAGHMTGEFWIPYSFMAESQPFANLGTGAPLESTNTSSYLSGDLSNVVVRLNDYVPQALAQSLYYEWSDANVIQPTPITLSLTMVDPFKVKGSVKKMLAIYGLRWGLDSQSGTPLYNYISNLSGLIIDNLSSVVSPVLANTSSLHSWTYPKPRSFMLGDYLVIPVSILGDPAIAGTGASSLDGAISSDAITYGGMYIDDTTGKPRFINLQEDLSLDVTTEYDVVTVVNYPAERALESVANQLTEPIPFQDNLSLSTNEWQATRDAFRDSLLRAAYDGVNLWIGEYNMAYHLGFIQGYDFHDLGQFPHRNTRAQNLDNAHLAGSNVVTVGDGSQVDYFSYPQANFYRRIVNLVPGLTDIGSSEYGDYVEGWNADDFLPNGNFVAYDIVDRPSGLQIGDLKKMSVFRGSKYFGETSGYSPWNHQTQRHVVISAHPDGIAGTVVAREQLSYYGPDNTVVTNPYANNVVTIAAEVGTVVRGAPISGRVFIELMDTDVLYSGIPEDADKSMWHGESGGVNESSWKYDTRRSKEVKTQGVSEQSKFDPVTGKIAYWQNTYTYILTTFGAAITHPTLSMHARGLKWLAAAPTLNAGDLTVHPTALELTLTTPAVTLSSVSSPATQVIGPMRLGMSFVYPANYSDGNIEADIFGPMNMSLDMHGLGSVTNVPPMSLTLTTPNPTLNVAADLVTVYLDADRNITVFLKEDN